MPFIFYVLFMMRLVGCLGKREEKYHVDTTFGNKMWETEEVQFQTSTKSVIKCVQLCSITSGCHSLVFYNVTNTCYGMKSVTPSTASFELSGAVFYKPVSHTTSTVMGSTTTTSELSSVTITGPTTTTYTEAQTTTNTNLLSCVSPFPLVANVSDSQLSSSSQYSFLYMAYMGKLNYAGGYWAPDTNRVEEYIQVDFLGLRVGTAVITQGGDTAFDNWITYYTISISIDCVTFTAIPDSNGFEQVFPGNTDRGSHVTNNLEPPVSVRCLRLHAQSWHTWIGIRFEVMGCIP